MKGSLDKYFVDSEILQYVNPKASFPNRFHSTVARTEMDILNALWKRKQVLPAYKCKTRDSNQWNLTALNYQITLANVFLHKIFHHQQPWCQVPIKIMLPIKQEFTYK